MLGDPGKRFRKTNVSTMGEINLVDVTGSTNYLQEIDSTFLTIDIDSNYREPETHEESLNCEESRVGPSEKSREVMEVSRIPSMI